MRHSPMEEDIAPRLARWLFADEAARPEPEPIGGPLGWLPPDLINCVIASILRLPVHPHVSLATSAHAQMSACAVKAFTRTCRGVRGSISYAHVAEVLCRDAWVPIIAPRAVRDPYPYRDRTLLQTRCKILFRVVLRAKDEMLLHCARQSCCRGTRERFNEAMQTSAPDLGAETLSRAAMGENTHASIRRVAERDAFILCVTSDGVAVHHEGRIVCTRPGPREVFAPGTEVAVGFSVPAPRDGKTYWAAWHAESQWLTVCSCDLDICKYNYSHPPRERWGRHRSAELLEYTMTTWDTRRNCVIDRRTVACVDPHRSRPMGFLAKHWTCGNVVWMAFIATDVGQFRDTAEVTLVDYVPGTKAPATVQRLPRFRNAIACLSVSDESGHFAIINRSASQATHQTMSYMLHFYDVNQRRMITLDGGDDCYVDDAVLISPSGAHMVLVRQAHSNLEIIVYTRGTGNAGMLGWDSSRRSTTTEIGLGMPQGWMELTSEAFSPCGSRALFFYSSEDGHAGANGVLVVDLVKTERSDRVEAEWHPWHAETMPAQVAWCEDGVFVRTATGGGVVRLGLVA